MKCDIPLNAISIYGFGSYFKSIRIHRDIDVLLLHRDTSIASCTFVLKCKQALMIAVPQIHVTMLSQSEEASLGFISKANAREVGSICAENFDSDIKRTASKLSY